MSSTRRRVAIEEVGLRIVLVQNCWRLFDDKRALVHLFCCSLGYFWSVGALGVWQRKGFWTCQQQLKLDQLNQVDLHADDGAFMDHE